jgi:hypothetical protein
MRLGSPVIWLAPALVLVACGPSGGDDEPGACTDTSLIAGDLVISEVFADADAPTGGSGADEGKEWFEIYNNSDRPVDLEGMTITHARPDDTMPHTHVMRGVTVPADGYLVLGNTLPDLVPSWVDYGYADALDDMFNTGGGKITLSCGASVIDSAEYDMVDAGVSRQFDGGGLPDYTANDDLANWCAATPEAADEFDPENFGTPGSPNEDCSVVVAGQCNDGGNMRDTVPPAPGDLVITEVHPQPSGDDNLAEWFEVLVTRDIDLNDVGLDRAGDSSGPKIIASEDCLPVTAGTYVVFAKSTEMTMNGGLPPVADTFSFSLVNGSAASPGDVQLLLGTTTLDAFAWTRSSADESLQVDPDFATAIDNDLEANWCNGQTPYNGTDLGTPGAANEQCAVVVPPGSCVEEGSGTVRPIVSPVAGDIAITEWMPNPSLVGDTAGEWLEIQALAAFDLNGLQVGDAALATTPVITTSTCVPIASGAYAIFAQGNDPLTNGMLPPVAGVFPSGVDLVNSNGTVQVGVGGVALDTKTYPTAASGVSIQIDGDGTQCNAPATTPAYNGVDLGTPGAVHAAECP